MMPSMFIIVSSCFERGPRKYLLHYYLIINYYCEMMSRCKHTITEGVWRQQEHASKYVSSPDRTRTVHCSKIPMNRQLT